MRYCIRYLLLLFLFLAAGVAQLPAQGVPEKVDGFPVPYGPTNAGREFWLAFPANWDIPGSASYYIRLYITSGVRTEVEIWAGAGIVRTIQTVPNDIVTVDLTPIQAQMFTRRDTDPVPPDRMYPRKAIHVKAKAPIVVYGMNRTTYTSDGILALPVNALGREYVVASYGAVIGVTQELPSQYMVIAPYNGTTVTINHPHRTPNHIAGETFTLEMDSGDVWSAMTVGFGGDMSGATIRANKPVAVVAGQNCAYIPADLSGCCCDHIVEMLLPTSAWGKIYHGVPFATRLRGDIYRVFAKEPNTVVYVNGNEVARLNHVGGQDGDGWFEYRALGKGLIEFSADKPISVTQYNPFQAYDNVPSDPFYLVLTPVEQYQTGLTFCTPAADFPQNFVNLVCDSAGFYEMEITPAGKEDWQPVWTMSTIGVVKKFASKVNGKTYVGADLEIKPGVYRMRGKKPFAGYIYGFSNFDSYGYPLSVAAGDLTKADKDAPKITKKQDCDGSVEVRTNDLPNNPDIRTNLASVELDPDPANTTNYELFVTPFEAGVSEGTIYKLKVTDKSKPARAIVIISDMAGNITLDTIIYNPLNVTLLPSPQDYGKLRVGTWLTKTLTLTNESDEPADLKDILLKQKTQGFEIESPKGPVVLGPKGSPTASVEVVIRYTATIMDSRTLQTYEDSVGVRDECGLRYLALVKAQVVKPMIRVTDHDFGVRPVDVETENFQMEVRNVSTIEGSTLTVHASSGPKNGSVKIFDVKGGDALQLPFTLEPGQTRTLRVSGKVPDIREYVDTIFFESDAMDVAEGDDYGWLRIEGIKGDLYATSYNWERRRWKKEYDAVVHVINRGSDRVQIRGISDPVDFEVVNKAQILNQWIEPNGQFDVQVLFKPQRTGWHEEKVLYTVYPEQDEEVSSTLRGYGTMPELLANDYDFGSMMADEDETTRKNYTPDVSNISMVFSVPQREEIDQVTITGFELIPDRSPANNLPEFGEIITLDLPKTLMAGESIEVNGYFNARTGGTRKATLRAITAPEDNVDAISNWTGVGLLENALIELQATTLNCLCVGETGEITATITNSGEADLTISRLEMDGGPFQITSPDPNQEFMLQRGESREVKILYTATKGTQQANLLVYNNASNTTNGVSSIGVAGYGLDETWNTTLALKPADGDVTAELGKEIIAELSLDETFAGMPTCMNMTTYTVVLEYNADLLSPRQPFQIGGGSSDGAVITRDQSSRPGRLVLNVAGFMESNDDALLRVPFAVLFNGEPERSMSAEVITDANCLVVNGTNATVPVDPICGLDLRMIELTSVGYTLDQNKPNPFNPVTKIRYSVGLDAHTTLHLYDAQGRLVQKLVDQYQQPGVYELTLDVTQLGSGNYYYTIVSGDFKETKMLTVVK